MTERSFRPLSIAPYLVRINSIVFAGIISISCAWAETSVGGSLIPAAQKHFDTGTGKTAAGDYAGAIIELTQAITIDPKYGKAFANRAAARFNLHDYKGAIADIDVALKYFPNMPYLVDLRQKSERAMSEAAAPADDGQEQRRAAANRLLQQAIIGGGDFADPSTMIMMNAQRRGLMSGGGTGSAGLAALAPHQQLNNPFGQNPGDADTSNASAKLAGMLGAGGGDNAAPPVEPGQAPEHISKGNGRLEAADYDGAIEEFTHAIQLDKSSFDAFRKRGFAYFKLGKFKSALADLQQADHLKPGNAEVKGLIEDCKAKLK